jgi:hypothetical protein
MPPLGFVVCGAPLAARSAEVARSLVRAGWDLTVGATLSASEWIDPQQLSDAAGQPTSTRLRRPIEKRRTPRPDRVVAFPLTFNTANKIAHGIMDNDVAGTLCDALAVGVPILATLMVSDRLWGHPAWSATMTTLEAAGVARGGGRKDGRPGRASCLGRGVPIATDVTRRLGATTHGDWTPHRTPRSHRLERSTLSS